MAKDVVMRKVFEAPLFVLLFTILVYLLCGCRSTRIIKTSNTDSVQLLVKTNNADSCADSVYVSHIETVQPIGIAGNNIHLVLPMGSYDSTLSQKVGNLTLQLFTDKNGNRHIDCSSDSLTLVLKTLRDSISRNKTVVHVADTGISVKQTTLKEVVAAAQPKWREMLEIPINIFAIIGLVFVCYQVFKVYARA